MVREHRVHRVVLEIPPEPVSAVLLSEPWSYPVFLREGCTSTYLLCTRCHFIEQMNLLRERPLHPGFLILIVLADIASFGAPCGLYPGLGTAIFGCLTRTELRFRYRLVGTGAYDAGLVGCCPAFAARQQAMELEKEGVTYPVPCHPIA